MNQFYVSIVFLGIILIVTALMWVVLDRKRAHDHIKHLDEKKEELVKVINDAELMLDELNKFSDYIITQINNKNDELSDKLRDYEEIILDLDKKANGKVKPLMNSQASDLILDSAYFESKIEKQPQVSSSYSQRSDKVIPINSRHKEILHMAGMGLSDTEIAKSLNMGKGEIELILGMNK